MTSKHHPLGRCSAVPERLDDLQALGDLLLLRLGRRCLHLAAQLLGELVDVDASASILADRLGAHLRPRNVFPVLPNFSRYFLLGEELRGWSVGLARVEDDVALAVEDLLEVLQRSCRGSSDARRQAFRNQMCATGVARLDVAQALAAHLRLDDLDAALFADDPPVLHALVLAAVALVVLDRTEDLRAEQAVALGLEGPVVDRLGLLHLAVRPLADLSRATRARCGSRKMDGILRLLETRVKRSSTGASRLRFRSLRLPAGYGPSAPLDQLDVQAQRLELLHQHVERLRESRARE